MGDSRSQNKRHAKAYNRYEIRKSLSTQQTEQKKIERKAQIDAAFTSWSLGVNNVRISLKIKFYSWLFKTARHLASQDIKTPHEVLISSNPNPYGAGIQMEGAAGLAIGAKAVQLLLMPIQKGIQYLIWKNQPDPVKPKMPTEERDPQDEAVVKKWTVYAQRQEQYQRELREKELLKPRFTRKDAGYLALDLTMLALTIATFAVAAPYASAAIALTAACVSLTVATYHLGKYLYQKHQMNKDIAAIDNFLKSFDGESDKPLTKQERDFLTSQKYRFAQNDKPTRQDAKEFLQTRSVNLNEAIQKDKQNIYSSSDRHSDLA